MAGRPPHPDRERASADLCKGDSALVVSERYGVALATVRLWERQLGLRPPAGGRGQRGADAAPRAAHRDARTQRIAELLEQGEPVNEIAELVGVSPQAVRQVRAGERAGLRRG